VIDRVERLTNLLALLLESSRPLTITEIVGALHGQYPDGDGARRQAFERDKAALRDIGVPIDTVTLSGGTAGYSIDRERYDLDLDLEPDERRALQMAFAAIRSTSGAGFGAGEEALWKLGGERVDGASIVTAAVPELPALPVLRDAAARRTTVGFGYHGRPRLVDPYGLLLRNGFWYVFGRDHGHDEQRTYRVDRIEGDVEVTGEPGAFVRPEGFDPRQAFPADAKLFGVADDAASRHDAATAKVRIAAPRAASVERGVGSERVVRRYKSGDIVVEVPCANLDAFASWVLGLVDHAVVLSPASARDAVVTRLSELTKPAPRRKARR
jgi:predicted DNA-binding transcriptional regulator YafY